MNQSTTNSTTLATEESQGKQQARSQVESICEMVAALELDWDRLEELRDERDALEEDTPEFERWPLSDSARELAELEEIAGDCEDADDARRAIDEDPLSVEVRSGWANVGEALTAAEFRIILCTGGPHVELMGELDDNNEPSRVRVLYRDWGDSGELFDFDREPVLAYCRCFYFGEG